MPLRRFQKGPISKRANQVRDAIPSGFVSTLPSPSIPLHRLNESHGHMRIEVGAMGTEAYSLAWCQKLRSAICEY